MKPSIRKSIAQVNMELWLVFSLFVVAAVLNFAISSNRVVLGLYTLPTLFAAYKYGRRHAMLTALASVLLVVLLALSDPGLFSTETMVAVRSQKWFDVAAWGGILIVTAYAMGTLYERQQNNFIELRRAYHGVLMILCTFISKDKYTQNHSYRVSIYATKIAAELGFDEERIEDVRAAALLHDIGKLDVSRDILYKAAKLTDAEFAEVQSHVDKGVRMLQPVGGALARVIPIILAHHDKFDGTGPHKISGNDIPLEARIIAVADTYDAVTSDRPYRKAMSIFEAKDIITKASGSNFDPTVVEAFTEAFLKNQMEVPEVMV
jgi:putative nucleotidyltransferase with HDIG domain